MSRSGRGRRWFVPTILCVGLALVLLYTWQSGQDSPRAPLPMPEGGELAERVPDAAELTPDPASSDPVPRGDDRGVVTGEIRVPSSLGEKDGSGITISILCEGQILALTPATPGRFEIEYPRPDPDVEYELRASGFGWISVSRRLTRSEQDVGTLRMIPGLCYGGVALDAEGNPVEGVRIRFYWNRELQGESDPTSSDGRFSVGVHATGLGGWSDQDLRKNGYLLPLERGVAYERVPCDPSGFSGEHEVRLVHDRKMVLRITDGETSLPAEGARCTVSVPVGPWPPRLQVIDTATADEDGLAPICWSPVMGTAHLSIQIERRTFTGFLSEEPP